MLLAQSRIAATTPSFPARPGLILPRRAPLRRPAILTPLLAAPLRYDSFLGGGGGGAAAQLVWAFTEGGNSTTGSFADIDFGAVAGDRELIVTIGWRGLVNVDITAVSIGGTAASLVVENTGGNTTNNAEIWQANVPTGTSGTVSVTANGTMPNRMSIAIYRATGLSSTTPIDTGIASALSGGNASIPLDAIAGGFVLAVANVSGDTFPNLDNLTIDFSGDAGSFHAARHGSLETPATGTFTVNSTSGATRRLAAATWF